MEIYELIIRYIRYLKFCGYSDHTLKNSQQSLALFKDFINAADVRQVTCRMMMDYQEKVMDEDISMGSKAIKLRHVRQFFEYLCQSHRLLINPAKDIGKFKQPNKKIGIVLTTEEVKRLFKQPDLSLPVPFRNYVMMSLLYSAGIRANELLNITVTDVQLKEKVIFISKGKGKKQRVVPLGDWPKVYLEQYIKKIRPGFMTYRKTNILFVTWYGRPLSQISVRQFLRKYRINAGIKKNVSPHTLRRSCATHMLQQGADIRYIQELLGHKRLSTTQCYTKVIPTEVKHTHSLFHPNLGVS